MAERHSKMPKEIIEPAISSVKYAIGQAGTIKEYLRKKYTFNLEDLEDHLCDPLYKFLWFTKVNANVPEEHWTLFQSFDRLQRHSIAAHLVIKDCGDENLKTLLKDKIKNINLTLDCLNQLMHLLKIPAPEQVTEDVVPETLKKNYALRNMLLELIYEKHLNSLLNYLLKSSYFHLN